MLIGVQSLWHQGDKEQLGSLKNELKDLESIINNQEEQLTDLNDELSDLETEISGYVYPEGIPNEYYEEYLKAIDDQRITLIVYKERYREYSGKVYRYNKTVEEANALAEEIGSTWFVTPFPARGN